MAALPSSVSSVISMQSVRASHLDDLGQMAENAQPPPRLLGRPTHLLVIESMDWRVTQALARELWWRMVPNADSITLLVCTYDQCVAAKSCKMRGSSWSFARQPAAFGWRRVSAYASDRAAENPGAPSPTASLAAS